MLTLIDPMKVLCFVVLISISLIQIGRAQDRAVKVDLYETSIEKKYLTEFQDNPFILLQALEARSEVSTQYWHKVTAKLDKNRSIKSQRFLKQLYVLTQQHLLKEYTLYASFSQTLASGKFDCVTGTATYGLLLDNYKIPYQIVMTGQHVYIKGQVDGMPFIIESTFPTDGLLLGEEAVFTFESKVVSPDFTVDLGMPAAVGSRNNLNSECDIIGLRELAGLQYYNNAIKKFYEEEYQKSFIQLMKAEFLYPSNKISALKQKMEVLLSVK